MFCFDISMRRDILAQVNTTANDSLKSNISPGCSFKNLFWAIFQKLQKYPKYLTYQPPRMIFHF